MARTAATRAIIAPGPMSNDLWRWADPDGQQRRVRLDELRAALAGGVIAPNTPVWKPGWSAWQPAHDVPELTTSALSSLNGVVPNIPPPPLAVVAVQHEFEAQAGVAEVATNEEPPPPPRYVPAPVKPSIIPPAPTSSASSLAPRASAPPAPSSGGTPAAPPAQSGSMGSSLPTTIGLPPPPDLLAAVAQAKANAAATPATPPSGPSLPTTVGMPSPIAPPAQAKPVPTKPPPPVGRRPSKPEVPPRREIVEEPVSESAFLADSGDPLDGLPAPTDPVVHGGGERTSDPGDVAGLPRTGGLSIILEDIRALRAGQKPKNKLIFPVLGLLAASILIMLIAGIASLFGGGPPEVATSGSASALTSASPSAAPSAPSAKAAEVEKPAEPAAAAAAPADLGPCTIAGEEKVIAPRAVVGTGIEAAPLNGSLVLGFAPSPGNGNAVALDPSSLAVSSTVKGKGPAAEVKRVTPAIANGRLVAYVDGERKNDKLASRRAVATSTPIDIGVAEGAIVWALHGKDGWAKLAPLDEDGAGPVEALRAVPLTGKKGVAFVFRRDGAVFFGAATGEGKLELAGNVVRVPGLGQVGSPAITTSDNDIIVAWADRAGAEEPWQIRWARSPIGGASTEVSAQNLVLPPGGLGEQAMSPAVSGLGKGRFVIAWTEGPVAQHQVRALTLDETGKVMGEPLTVSSANVNAGQPQVAVDAEGRGVVAYLGAKGRVYELRAAPLRCAK